MSRGTRPVRRVERAAGRPGLRLPSSVQVLPVSPQVVALRRSLSCRAAAPMRTGEMPLASRRDPPQDSFLVARSRQWLVLALSHWGCPGAMLVRWACARSCCRAEPAARTADDYWGLCLPLRHRPVLWAHIGPQDRALCPRHASAHERPRTRDASLRVARARAEHSAQAGRCVRVVEDASSILTDAPGVLAASALRGNDSEGAESTLMAMWAGVAGGVGGLRRREWQTAAPRRPTGASRAVEYPIPRRAPPGRQ